MKLRAWILPLILFFPFAQISLAQNEDWGVVKQLPQGQKVKVVTTDGKSHTSALESVTDDSIQLKNFTASKQDVKQVLMLSGGHRGRHALIGAAIGAGVGLGIGVKLDDDSYTQNKAKEIAIPGLAALGALIGVALPSHGKWREVYRGK